MKDRETPRFSAEMTVNCRVPASPTSATIEDISTSGCRIEVGNGVVMPGGAILLELLPGFHAIGHVVWKTETEAGINFDCPLDQSLVDHIADSRGFQT